MPAFRTMLRTPVVVATMLLLAACSAGTGNTPDATLRISGSTTVNPVAADAAAALRTRFGQAITVDTQGGSAGGLAQLCRGEIDIAMSSKPVADSDRQQFPQCRHQPVKIGEDAVGIVVRREVYDGGVRNLTREQVQSIFEARVSNWRDMGGPDLEIFIYDKEPGRGTREMLDKFLYGAGGTAPPPPDSNRFAVVGGNEETRTKLLSTPGSVGPLSTSFVTDYPGLAVVALDGVAPTPELVATGRYPMSRPLYLVTNGPPTGRAKEFIDYVLAAEGQQLLTRHGYLTLAQLGR